MSCTLNSQAIIRTFSVRTGPGAEPAAGEAAALLMIRPAGVQLCPSDTGEHHVTRTVADVAFRGRGCEHAIDIPGHARLSSVFSDTRAERGELVGLRLDPRGCHRQRPARGAGGPAPASRTPAAGRAVNGGGAAPATAVPGRHHPRARPPCATRDRPARAGASIRAVTTTLTLSTSAPSSIDADAVVIGVIKGEDGPVLAPGAEDVDHALGGTLAATLAALGATGAPGR